MAEEVVVLRWCDPHLDAQERVDGHQIVLGANGEVFTMDVCDEHEKWSFAELINLLPLFGQPFLPVAPRQATRTSSSGKTYSSPAKGENLPCPYGCKRKGEYGFVSMQGLMNHMSRTHDSVMPDGSLVEREKIIAFVESHR
jgi:hypothetical protein